MSNGAEDALLGSLYSGRVQVYLNVACFAAAVYDTLHTLPQEVQYIWLSRTNIATVLYYITRYGIYLDYIVQTYHDFTPSITPKWCDYTNWIVGYAFDICIWSGEALLGLRVWALCGQDRRLTIALPVIFVALCATSLVSLGTFFHSFVYQPSPAPTVVTCIVVQANGDIIKTIVCAAVWIILMVILLLISGYREYKTGGNSRFVIKMYREGLLYYCYSFLLHVGNLIAFCTAPPEISSILTSPTRFLHVAFTSRVLLNTRRYAHQTTVMPDETLDGETWPSASRSFAV